MPKKGRDHEAAAFRDVLIHDYFGINTEAVRDTIEKNLPALKKGIRRVLREERVAIPPLAKGGRGV